MKEILIIFAILLLILTLISAFGGSIRYTERFYEAPQEKDKDAKLLPAAGDHPASPEQPDEPPMKVPTPPPAAKADTVIEPFDGGHFAAV